MILFSPAFPDGNEALYLRQCLDTGGASFVGRYEQAVSVYTGAGHAIGCRDGAAALHLALKLLEVRAGDYVILPNIASAAAAHAISYTGAAPILLDIHPQNWQLDLDLLEDFLGLNTMVNGQDDLILKRDGRRVRAIMAVHLLGNMCDMERLLFIARRYHLEVVEDAAEALGSFYRDAHAGVFGRAAVIGFEAQAAMPAGSAVVSTPEAGLAALARSMAMPAPFSPEEAIQQETGFDYRLSPFSAAAGLARMEQAQGHVKKQQAISSFYRQSLAGIGDIRFQAPAEGVTPNGRHFALHTARMRGLQQYLHTHGIESRPLWPPVNQLPMYQKPLYIRREEHAAAISGQTLRIPCHPQLADDQPTEIVNRIATFFS